MRWPCPHCSTLLAVPDDKLGPGWSFSRCYKCAGFALIRKAELSIIKVDRAPTGERVLLPDAPALSQAASRNYDQIVGHGPATPAGPVIRPAKPRGAAAESRPLPLEEELAETEAEIAPEAPRRRRLQATPALHVGIGMAGTLALCSGFYLYMEAHSLWHASKRISAAKQAHEPVTVAANVVTDQVQQAAMAPIRAEPAPPSALTVTTRVTGAKIYGGPGLQYPTVSEADPHAQYVVADWNDRWFKVALPGQSFGQSFGWIRNDQVRLVHGDEP